METAPGLESRLAASAKAGGNNSDVPEPQTRTISHVK